MEGAKDPVRIAKWTAIAAGSLLVLLVLGVFVLTSVIDPNRYRGQVERIVADLTGRPLVIEGNLEITWFPWLGVRMGHAHLGDVPDAAGAPLAEWDSLSVAAKVVPLLKGQVVVDRIRLQNPHIHLRRDRQGRGNWEDLGPRRQSASAAETLGSPSAPGPKTNGGPAPPTGTTGATQVAGLEIRDGMLDYADEETGQQVSLSDLRLDVGEWRAGRTLPVSMKFIAHADSLPPQGVKVELETAELGVRIEPPLNVAAPKVTLRVADAKIDGDFNFDRTSDSHLNARGSADIQVPSVRKLAADLALNQTMPRDPTTLGPLELRTRWSYVDGAVEAKPISLRLDGVNFNGWVERTSPPRSAWRFELHGDRIDLGRYVKIDTTSKKPFELPVEALRSLNANGSVIFDQAVLADARMSDVRLEFQTPDANP